MKLVLLGPGGYYANERRHTACLMLPELGLVLDAGSGLFRLRDYLVTDRLDVFLTHAHLDHVLGLTYLLDVVPPNVLERTTVYGSANKLDAIRTHLFCDTLFPGPGVSVRRVDGPCRVAGRRRADAFPARTIRAARSDSASTGRAARWPM